VSVEKNKGITNLRKEVCASVCGDKDLMKMLVVSFNKLRKKVSIEPT
jgi:hypothetical protein